MRRGAESGEGRGRPAFLEFFAGGGMARAGLEPQWRCALANDVDARKAASYRANYGAEALVVGDVRDLRAESLPDADLAWASFPCQDLSLAGARAGLAGARSGAFFGFADLVAGLVAAGRAPRLVAIENVAGLLTARGGMDFAALVATLSSLGYRSGALAMDAAHFTPQSRPRLFVVGTREGIDPALLADGPSPHWGGMSLARAVEGLPEASRRGFVWWRLPEPPRRNAGIASIVESEPGDWDPPARTGRLLALMAPAHRARLAAAQASGAPVYATLFRRTRRDAEGRRAQRAEARFDGLAGCLRTPGGGSSRQILLRVEGESVRSRLLSPREAARLMGLPDAYHLPQGATDAYHLIGDGVVAPVVRFLSQNLLLPLLAGAELASAA